MLRVAVCALLLSGTLLGADERPKRKTIPIGTSWNLTAEKHDRTVTDGKRTKLLTSTGHATLKHGANVVKGPWDLSAKAEKIECDFPAKQFTLTGSPVVEHLDPRTGTVSKKLTGNEGAKITISFDTKTVTTSGNVTTTPDSPK